MKQYDVLLTYEIRNREIENLCLIKRELERRGYTVGMCMQYDTYFEVPEPVEAEVVVIPAYYRPRAKYYTSSHLLTTKKIVNMRWEQIVGNAVDSKLNSLYSIKDWGKEAVHISWGEDSFNTMTKEWGVPESHVRICGHVTLDYLRPQMRAFFYDRDTLFKKYGVPADARTHLYISSFSLTGMHSRVVNHAETSDFSDVISQNVKATAESQKITIEWFEKILSETEDDVIIYRPHPEEKNNEQLLDLQRRCPRFRVIGDESVKQWIIACDKIYTWVSTSIAEIYASGKSCAILRPTEVPFDIDMTIYNGSKSIDKYDDFKRVFESDQTLPFPIEESRIRHYYDIDPERYTFERVCDVIEEVLKDDGYSLSQPLKNPFGKTIFNKYRFENAVKRYLAKSKLMNSIQRKDRFKNTKFRENLDDVFYVRDKLKKNHVSDEEIAEIISRIDKALS